MRMVVQDCAAIRQGEVMSTTTITLVLVHETCYLCGIVFGLSPSHMEELRRSHGSFYCPNGHCQKYLVKSAAEVERAAREIAEQALVHARSRMARIEASRNSLRGVITRTKRRVAAGVCPCCKRSFAALAGHMKTKHPEYAND